jgi:hypothetical protein
MRIAVLVLAVLGSMSAGFLGVKWVSDAGKYRDLIKTAEKLGVAPDAVRQAGRLETAGYLLMLAAPVGLAGGAASMLGRKRVAAGLLIGAAVVPCLFAAKALLFTFLLLVAAGLALAVKSTEPMFRTRLEAIMSRA